MLLWRLLTAESILLTEYQEDGGMQELLCALRERRLLVEDSDDDPSGLHAAHDALLRHWPRAVEFRTTHATDIGLWLDLNRESRQWLRGERTLIPVGPQLATARALDARWQGLWTARDRPALDYIRQSARQADRRRALTRIVIGVSGSLAALFGAALGYDTIASRYLTRIDFKDASLPPGDTMGADANLHHHATAGRLIPAPSGGS